jgi:predicted ATP-dependent endonuclease of OLD family
MYDSESGNDLIQTQSIFITNSRELVTAVDPSAFISMMRGEEVFPARQIDEALQ